MKWLILALVIFLLPVLSIAAQDSIEIQVIITQDSLTLYIPGSAHVNLDGLGFQTRHNNRDVTHYLSEFVDISLTSVQTPICFRLERNGTDEPLPLACQPPTTTFDQRLVPIDVFWWNPITRQNQTVTIIQGSTTPIKYCLSGEADCTFSYVPPPTPIIPPTPISVILPTTIVEVATTAPTMTPVPPTAAPTTIPAAPTARVITIRASEELFEGGRMFYLRDSHIIWAVTYTGQGRGFWSGYRDPYQASDPVSDPSIVAPGGRFQPIYGFGKLWRESGLRQQLGWGLTEEIYYNARYEEHPGYYVLYSRNGQAMRFDRNDYSWTISGN